MKKLTVTIGMSVFNEEANIEKLIKSILSQKEVDYKLSEIIIVSDNSTDKTNSIIKSFRSRKINLINNRRRQGQQLNQNIILRRFKSEVLVILEGDIILMSQYTINELVKPFVDSSDKYLGLTVGMPVTMSPQTFLERILFYGYGLKYDIFKNWNGGQNLYTCGGHAMRAINRNFAEKLLWPKNVPEDAYLYLRMKELGLTMQKQTKATVMMRNVTNIRDRIRQCSKFNSGKKTLENYFNKELLVKEYKIPFSISVIYTLKWLVKHPFWVSLYLIEMVLNRIVTYNKKQFDALYQPYQSSKTLSIQ